MSRYRFTAPAKQDLQEIAAHIRRDNPEAAKRVVQRIREVCKTTLVMFPEGGTQRDELSPGLRCFSVGNYVNYFCGQNPVEIVRVLHVARDVMPGMFR
jgi:plasmid stabilization system protein ParE